MWSFKFKDADGRYHEKSTGCRKYPEAQRFRSKFLSDLAAGTLPLDTARWSLQEAMQEHLDHVRATRATSSLPPERSAVKNLLRVLAESTRLEQLGIQHLRRYQVMRRDEGAGPKTINNELNILIGALKSSNLWRRMADAYRPLEVPEAEVGDALSPDELVGLIQTAKQNPRWFVAFNAALLAASTGMRHKEVRTLRLRDVCLEGPEPHITLARVNTKTNRSARIIPLNDYALYATTELMKRAELLGANRPDHYLLPANLGRHTKRGDPLNGKTGYDPTRHQENWSSAWESLKKEAGLPNLRFHDLRHTYITHAREEGVDLELVMTMVGHVSPRMTRHYSHIGTDVKRNAALKVQQKNAKLAGILNLPSEKGGSDES